MPPQCQLLSGSLCTTRTLARTWQTPRTFSTSAALYKNPLARRRGGDLGSHLPKHVIPEGAEIPEYPYGPNLLFKQSNKGLYGGQMIQFGNNVSRKTETKTRRIWKPNVLSKSLYSVALKKRIKLRITSKVLKTIDREGGLDEYLLKQSEHRLKELGPTGWALRWVLLQKPDVVAKMRADAAALGLSQEQIDLQWPEPVAIVEDTAKEAAETAAIEAALDTEENMQSNEVDKEPKTEHKRGHEEQKRANELRRIEHKLTRRAAGEYTKALPAAKRYLARGLVDTEEDGIKLAFIREKERAAAREQNRNAFKQNLQARFGSEASNIRQPQDPQYLELKKKAAEAAGGYDEWKSQITPPEIKAKREAQDEAVLLTQRKAESERLIKEAESAASNDIMAEERRRFLVSALEKASRCIEAGSKQTYIEATVASWREQKANQWPFATLEAAQRETEVTSGKDAWAALVDSTRPASDSRVNV